MRGFVHKRDSISPSRTVRESVRSSTENSHVRWFKKMELFVVVKKQGAQKLRLPFARRLSSIASGRASLRT